MKLTPALCFTVALLDIAFADGVFQKEEDLYIASTVIGHEELLEQAAEYLQSMDSKEFLYQSNNLLSYEQKLCVLINMLDLLYSDGAVELEEKEKFNTYMQAFGINQETINPHLNTIILKNEREIFE